MVDVNAIIKIAEQGALAFNKVIDQFPTKEQRALNEFFKFVDKYKEEVSRADSDFDDLISWRERKLLLLETFISKVTNPSKK